MKKLLNTLFVTSEDIYLSLDGENVLANRDHEIVARYPLHTLQGIVTFSYAGASPALMGKCASNGISLAFCTPRGRFLARVSGENNGNVLLRRQQYRIADDLYQSCRVARSMVFGKIYNCRQSLERTRRDHTLSVGDRLDAASEKLKLALPGVSEETDLDRLRGVEGAAAKVYFACFDSLILQNKGFFTFETRNRRPPTDPINALLSFAYSLLANDCASALESVGLDAYVGFMHCDRPGRASLALDLMEELRPCVAERFVLTLVNNRVLSEKDFERQESGAVYMIDNARRSFLKHWQDKKQEKLTHPFLGEKLQWGMVPYVQALMLARYIRGDTDAYPPFLWK